MNDAIKAAIKAARDRDAAFLKNGVIVGTVAGRMEIRFAEALAVAVKSLKEHLPLCAGMPGVCINCTALNRIAAILEGKP